MHGPVSPLLEKHRLEALSDGIYAIAMTLLVLELKVPDVPRGAGEQALMHALAELLPKILIWVVSFWVMSMFWMAQYRLYRLTSAFDWVMVRLELLQLALISLLPFSTALMGEYGGHVTSAAIYSGHLFALGILTLCRTLYFLRHSELHTRELTPEVARVQRLRNWGQAACTGTTFALAFAFPGWNALAMIPMAFLPTLKKKLTHE
ncbi:MAG: TMEM175 family protein [Ramlibacter sp.]